MQKWSVSVAWAFVGKYVVCHGAFFFLPAVKGAQRCQLLIKYLELRELSVSGGFFALYFEHVSGLIYDDPIPNLKFLLKSQNYGSGF